MKMLSNTKAELKKAQLMKKACNPMTRIQTYVYQKVNIVNSLKKNCAYEMDNL